MRCTSCVTVWPKLVHIVLKRLIKKASFENVARAREVLAVSDFDINKTKNKAQLYQVH